MVIKDGEALAVQLVRLEGSDTTDFRLKQDMSERGWIHLAHDRDRWRALVRTVMNFAHHRR
jgi:hypothetical protein